MKKILISLSTMALLFVGGAAQATCGGMVMSNNDCAGNSEHTTWSCCPQGMRVNGIVYNDLNGEDGVNAVVAYCRQYKGNETSIANADMLSGGQGHVTIACDATEVMSALGCSDLKGKDKMDGCVIQCYNPTTKASRWLNPNGDIGHPASISAVKLPNRIQGIGYKKEHGHTDRVDCAEVSYKNQPIVQ
ncbi:MAG: hypothetical protein H7A33_04715 [Deltaproteobacteria bacterium]|nr:hypothetical protein [Deltaproteobacteria bacterium]